MKKFKPLVILGKNGWQLLPPGSKETSIEDFSAYKARFIGKNYFSTVYAIVSAYKRDLEADGHYGVLWLEASYEYKQPVFTWDDLADLEEAIRAAEENLLTIGMPFSKTYRFHGEDKLKMERRNEELRRLYNLDELEEEALSMEGGKKV
jgi:hypothetical protein